MGLRGTVEERFLLKVQKTEECWLWTGSNTGGYGNFWYEGKNKRAHRVAYVLFVGPLSDDDEIHHKCNVPACVNPRHLEKTTHVQNLAYKKSNKCKRGHDKIEVGVRTDGRCVQCYRDYMRWYYRNAGKPAAEREPLP